MTNGSPLVSIAKKMYRPVALFNSKKVVSRLNWWKEHLPSIQPYYAIKSYSDKCILEILSKHNIAGFDVASREEISKVIRYNKPIILSHPFKSIEDIEHAKKTNVSKIVCNTLDEIEKVLKYYKEADIIWRVKSSEQYSQIKFNSKFGASLDDSIEAIKLVDNIKGISFHVGSKCSNMNAYTLTLNMIKNVLIPEFQNKNRKCELIDIGGGFNDENDIISLKEAIKDCDFLKNHMVIAEPGRYFSKNSLTLFTKVIAVKKDYDKYNIYINDSIYNSFSGKFYDHQEFNPIALYNGELKNCCIWGNTCDSGDMIIDNVMLPLPKEGDVIQWDSMGAYSIASSVNGFNGFKKPKIFFDYDNKI